MPTARAVAGNRLTPFFTLFPETCMQLLPIRVISDSKSHGMSAKANFTELQITLDEYEVVFFLRNNRHFKHEPVANHSRDFATPARRFKHHNTKAL